MKRIIIVIWIGVAFGFVEAQDNPNEVILPIFNSEGWILESEGMSGSLATIGNDTNCDSGGQGCEEGLQLQADFLGTGSRESISVYKSFTDDLQDWSAFELLSIDVYVPSETQGIAGQLFLMSHVGRLQQGTIEVQLVPGQWTVLRLNLGDLSGIDQVERIGIRLSASLTAPLAADILIENARLTSQQLAVAVPIAPVEVIPELLTSIHPSIDPASDAAVLYDFETSIRPWELAQLDLWTGGQGVALGSVGNEGSCLQLQVDYSGEAYIDAGAQVLESPLGVDWSAYTALAMDIFVPRQFEGGGVKFYLTYGQNQTWVESEYIGFHDETGWTEITVLLSEMSTYPRDPNLVPDLSSVHEVGVKIGTQFPFEGNLCIDNVRLLRGDSLPPDLLPACLTDDTVLVSPQDVIQVNIRSGPSELDEVVGKLLPGMSAVAYARNERGDWLRINPDYNWWVLRSVVRVQGNWHALPLATTDVGLTDTNWLYRFDTDSSPWKLLIEGTAGKAVARSLSPADKAALAVVVDYPGGTYIEAGTSALISISGADWSQCRYLMMNIFVTPRLSRGGFKLFMRIGEDWQWVETEYVGFERASGWIPISASLQDMRPYPPEDIVPDLTGIREIGVKVGTSSTYQGLLFIDDVRLAR